MARALRLLPLLAPVAADWTGILGLPFESDKPVEQRAMHCSAGFITGLQVRRGRNNKDDTDFYDFKLKCGSRWGPWSGMAFEDNNAKEEKSFECPMKMHMTGLEVKRGYKEIGDVDSYDFRLQCSGVWQSFLGLSFASQKASANKECPPGMMAYGWRAYRGFVKRGDKDFYEFDLNCKAATDGAAAVRKSPSLREIGLPQNVFVWGAKDIGTWLTSLGLGEYAPAFEVLHAPPLSARSTARAATAPAPPLRPRRHCACAATAPAPPLRLRRHCARAATVPAPPLRLRRHCARAATAPAPPARDSPEARVPSRVSASRVSLSLALPAPVSATSCRATWSFCCLSRT
jgi:hypothetical protein